jgi:hypothetical protein
MAISEWTGLPTDLPEAIEVADIGFNLQARFCCRLAADAAEYG